MSSYKKSSTSGNGGCVEISVGLTEVLVRDTKDRTGAFLVFNYREWAEFLAGAARGEFDLPGGTK